MKGVPKASYILLALPTIAYLVFFWLIPLSNVVVISFTEGESFILGRPRYIGFQNYAAVIESYASTIRNTIILPLSAAFIDFIAGYPLAYLLVRRKILLQNVLRASLLFPYFGDIYVSYGLWNMFLPGGIFDALYSITGLSYRHVLYTPYAVVLGFSIFTLPFMVLYTSASLSEIDPSIEEAAHTLGASPLKTFIKVTLPLSAPGAVSGFIACFGWNLGGYLIPLLLGGVEASNVVTVKVVHLTLQLHNYGLAASLATILIAMTLLSTYLTFKITKVAG